MTTGDVLEVLTPFYGINVALFQGIFAFGKNLPGAGMLAARHRSSMKSLTLPYTEGPVVAAASELLPLGVLGFEHEFRRSVVVNGQTPSFFHTWDGMNPACSTL